MSLEPVPTITIPSSPTASVTAASTSHISSPCRVGDSPVVPATSTQSVPVSTRWRANAWVPSRSSDPSGAKGVAMAVVT